MLVIGYRYSSLRMLSSQYELMRTCLSPSNYLSVTLMAPVGLIYKGNYGPLIEHTKACPPRLCLGVCCPEPSDCIQYLTGIIITYVFKFSLCFGLVFRKFQVVIVSVLCVLCCVFLI